MFDSRVLDDIADDRGWDQAQLNRELDRRVEVLEYLVENDITWYEDVARVIHTFMSDQEQVMEAIRDGDGLGDLQASRRGLGEPEPAVPGAEPGEVDRPAGADPWATPTESDPVGDGAGVRSAEEFEAGEGLGEMPEELDPVGPGEAEPADDGTAAVETDVVESDPAGATDADGDDGTDPADGEVAATEDEPGDADEDEVTDADEGDAS